MNPPTVPAGLNKKDFISDQEVRWCPGCGDYAVLNAVQSVLPTLGIPRENFVVVSGIGCSSRFPYYMNTYGVHSIHGRALPIATGIAIANPDLSVWVVTGDGDGLSIGGNHLLHALRRNLNIKILLFDNRIYSLTKGQYSPTSEQGKPNKTAPMGIVDRSINPVRVALASGATFVARSVDVYVKHLQEVLRAAAEHRGSAFVHILQNCVIFNDGAFKGFTDRSVREENNLFLEHGKPLLFGDKARRKGLRFMRGDAEIVDLGPNWDAGESLPVHDEKLTHVTWPSMLAGLQPPRFPMPVGIFRRLDLPTYEDRLYEQMREAREKSSNGGLQKLFRQGHTWKVS